MQLYKKSATELAAMLKAKECSSVELVESVLSRIEATDDKVGAYLNVCKDSALDSARAIDNKRLKGEALAPIAGIPVSLKDNICTNGVATTCSSKMLENFVPPYDATVVSRLKESGAIIAGKLNMDEFAMGSSCETSAFKLTKNPRNLNYVPGGSSGGSAASVAAGSAIFTLGSDTGGSIRQPASYCGIVGLKPTYGSVSRYGVVAFASSLDQVGPLGRTVKDVAMLYNTICGKDEMDATSKALSCVDFNGTMYKGVKGLRIGVPAEYFGAGVSEVVKQKVMAAIKVLELEGAVVKPISLPSTGYALPAYYIIACAEASSNLARFDGIKYGYRAKEFDSLTDLYERSRSEGFGDEVKRRIMLGTYVLSSGFHDAYYDRAKLLQKRITAEFAAAFADCDVIATPTSPFTAFKIGENIGDPLKMYAADICTINVNIAGLPAISVPCGTDEGGLPIGLQLIGQKFSEPTLFNTADHYEMLCGSFNVVSEI